MPEVIECPTCQFHFSAPERFGVEEMPCPACQQPVSLLPGHNSKIDVFLCHSVNDKATVNAVCRALESSGIQCWIAPRDILAGENWARAIVNAIGRSRMLLLILSAHSNVSEQVLREVERAVNRKIPIVVFHIEDVRLTRDLEYFVSGCHHVRVEWGSVRGAIRRLPRVVCAVLAGRTRPQTAAPARPAPSAGRTWSGRQIAATAGLACAVVATILLAWGAMRLRSRTAGPEAGATEKFYQTLVAESETVNASQSSAKAVNWSSTDRRFKWTEQGYEAVLVLPGGVEMDFNFAEPGTPSPLTLPDVYDFGNDFDNKGYWYGVSEVTEEQWDALSDIPWATARETILHISSTGAEEAPPFEAFEPQDFAAVDAVLKGAGLNGFAIIAEGPVALQADSDPVAYYVSFRLIRTRSWRRTPPAPSKTDSGPQPAGPGKYQDSIADSRRETEEQRRRIEGSEYVKWASGDGQFQWVEVGNTATLMLPDRPAIAFAFVPPGTIPIDESPDLVGDASFSDSDGYWYGLSDLTPEQWDTFAGSETETWQYRYSAEPSANEAPGLHEADLSGLLERMGSAGIKGFLCLGIGPQEIEVGDDDVKLDLVYASCRLVRSKSAKWR